MIHFITFIKIGKSEGTIELNAPHQNFFVCLHFGKAGILGLIFAIANELNFSIFCNFFIIFLRKQNQISHIFFILFSGFLQT